MTSFSQPRAGSQVFVPALELSRRKPQRVTATLPWHLVHRLEERASYEGRSLSNLIAHLLEVAGKPATSQLWFQGGQAKLS